jgi:hypothetical protein
MKEPKAENLADEERGETLAETIDWQGAIT